VAVFCEHGDELPGFIREHNISVEYELSKKNTLM
jgi:hypothetical protein